MEKIHHRNWILAAWYYFPFKSGLRNVHLILCAYVQIEMIIISGAIIHVSLQITGTL